MNLYYSDILERIHEPPVWFDEHAVPRFNLFTPYQCANIYASQVVLFLIECQSCKREFLVAMSWAKHDEKSSLADDVKSQQLNYGDPPNVDCCQSGPTMMSVPRRVLEFWTQDRDWKRVPELEINVKADWDTDD